MRRNVVWLILSLGLFSLVNLGCVAPPASTETRPDEAETASAEAMPDQVTIGIQLVTSADIIVKQQGWAEEMIGVPIKWVTFDSGRDAILGLGAGGVDMVLVGSAPTAFGLSTGVPGEVAWIFHLLGANEALVARSDSGIAAVEDLAGKTAAVPFGSTTHYDMLQALVMAGLSPDDLTLLDMDPNSMVAAFERGDIDAGWVWFPALDGLYKAGGEVVIDALDMAEAGFPTSDVLVVNPDFGAAHPGVVAKYIASLNRAVLLDRDDPEAAAQNMVDEFGLELEIAKTALTQVKRLDAEEHLQPEFLGTSDEAGAFAQSLWSQAHFLKEQALIEEAFELDFYQERVSPRYIELALAEGYISE